MPVLERDVMNAAATVFYTSSVLITSSLGDFVELRVDGYQYGKSPSAPVGGWDENWLMIAGRIRRGPESWVFREPCLTTWEAQDLLRWLRRAVDANPEPVDFTEPHLSFEATSHGGSHTTVVTFRGEAAPPSTSDEDRWDVGCGLTLDLREDSLAAAADAWEREIAAYPPR